MGRLVAEHSRTPAGAAFELEPEELLRRLSEGDDLIAGREAIVAWLAHRHAPGTRAYYLFGGSHDSAAQLVAFRRLFGVDGLGADTVLVLESSLATGHWRGVAAAQQAGDSEVLARFLSAGAPADWVELRRRHEEHDYAAYKYGLLDEAMDIVATARSAGQRVLACDMPRAALDGLELPDAQALRLRELHCALALEHAGVGPTAAVAVLFGDSHVGPDGLRRFLAPDSRVVALHVVGDRLSEHSLEAELEERLRLTDPVLVPGPEQDHVLLLPGRHLGIHKELRRQRGEALPEGAVGVVSVMSEVPLRAQVGEQIGQVDEGAFEARVGPGHHLTRLTSGSRLTITSVDVPAGAAVELDVQPGRVSVLLRSP